MDGPSNAETDETDDPIVREIPIIHSKRLEEILHIFQYPLRQKQCTNEHNIKKCFYKPKNQEIKLELGIDVNSPNFDSVRAEIIANEVDGEIDPSKKDKQVFFENEIVDKVFLESSRTVKEANKYALAAYNGKEIHLTSVKGIFQFRPKFPYMEKGLKRKKETEVNADDEEEAGPSNAQQVTVKFKQSDERWKKSKETSYKQLQAKSAEEPWTECEWYETDTPLSSVERLKLMSDNMDDIGQAKSLSDMEYLKLLVPEDQEQTPLEPTLPSHVLSLHALRALPLLEQCRLLLKDAQIIQFQQLLMLLAGEGVTTDTLLKTLTKVAVLVRGNWIVKSDVLYPSNTFSATSGVPAELMCRARDYVLYLFSKNQHVERKKVSSMMKIPSEEIKEIFTGISKLRTHSKGWELHLPTDQDFISKHSDLVQKQNLFLEHRFHQLTEFMKDNKAQRRKSRSESKSVSEDGRVRNGLSFSSDNDSGTEKNKSPVVARKNKSVKVTNHNSVNVPTDVNS